MEKYSYSAFAYVYDELMDNVPYDAWAEYLIGLLKENGVVEGLVCELGCGTGQMTRRLAAAGYDMIGIDLSEEMLDVAREQEYGAYEGDFEEEEEVDDSTDTYRNECQDYIVERDEEFVDEDKEPHDCCCNDDVEDWTLFDFDSDVTLKEVSD